MQLRNSYVYLFVFVARKLLDGLSGFPPSEGFPFPFLISLGTLLATQVVSSARGVKGAGPIRPSMSDLLTHGGVLALDRVQQLVWTLIAGLGFLYVAITTYSTLRAVPAIPEALLLLMGLSSAGYVGGKLARKPGPNIERAVASDGKLTIYGDRLSPRDEIRIWLDQNELTKDRNSLKISQEPERAPADGFVREITVELPGKKGSDLQGMGLRVVNSDGQFADCVVELQPAVAIQPRIDRVEVSGPDAQNRLTLTLHGDGILAGTKLSVDQSTANGAWTQDAADPKKWTAVISQPAAWLKQEHAIEVTNPDGQKATSTLKPA